MQKDYCECIIFEYISILNLKLIINHRFQKMVLIFYYFVFFKQIFLVFFLHLQKLLEIQNMFSIMYEQDSIQKQN